jgi:hypothetical protein
VNTLAAAPLEVRKKKKVPLVTTTTTADATTTTTTTTVKRRVSLETENKTGSNNILSAGADTNEAAAPEAKRAKLDTPDDAATAAQTPALESKEK